MARKNSRWQGLLLRASVEPEEPLSWRIRLYGDSARRLVKLASLDPMVSRALTGALPRPDHVNHALCASDDHETAFRAGSVTWFGGKSHVNPMSHHAIQQSNLC